MIVTIILYELKNGQTMSKIRCVQCQINFKNYFTFSQHDCVVKEEEMSSKELLHRYNTLKIPIDYKSN